MDKCMGKMMQRRSYLGVDSQMSRWTRIYLIIDRQTNRWKIYTQVQVDKSIPRYRRTNRWTQVLVDERIDGKIYTQVQVDKRIDGQKYSQVQTDKQMDKGIVRWTNRWTKVQLDERIDGKKLYLG